MVCGVCMRLCPACACACSRSVRCAMCGVRCVVLSPIAGIVFIFLLLLLKIPVPFPRLSTVVDAEMAAG